MWALKTLIFCLLIVAATCSGVAQISYSFPHNESFTYEEVIQAFSDLDSAYSTVKLFETSFKTDVGRNLHIAVYNSDQRFTADSITTAEKTVVFINNAIHPGESCGVDASVKLFEYLGENYKQFKDVIVVAIPVYNIGGMLNRSPYKRSGQPGPVECGFRGNYQHLDLNRDFIKADALNTMGFIQIFQHWKPHVFMDTHTTNGSDHQYTVSLISSQRAKMNPVLAKYMAEEMEPAIYEAMKEQNREIVPYVYTMDKTLDKGIKDFLETPRYSSGYTNLFNCLSFISEAHKYKPFEQRVLHTYTLLKTLVEYSNSNSQILVELKTKADKVMFDQSYYPLNWSLDTTEHESLSFNAFDWDFVKSNVTGQKRINYNTAQPKNITIPHFRTYIGQDVVEVPDYYVIPQAYPRLIQLLKINGVSLSYLQKDTVIEGEMYKLEDVQSLNKPYEKHFLHKHVHVTPSKQHVKFYRGDVIVSTQQKAKRFLVETLEPHAADSYFRWNYFDNVLQQKEWFSEFAFDEIAEKLLENDALLKRQFEEKRMGDSSFSNSHFAQLYWIFKRSPYYEAEYNRYPVMRIL
jgi:hypothetical protein